VHVVVAERVTLDPVVGGGDGAALVTFDPDDLWTDLPVAGVVALGLGNVVAVQ
jgi:hypothetical protein